MRAALALPVLALLAACHPTPSELAECQIDAEKMYPHRPPNSTDIDLDDPDGMYRTDFEHLCMLKKGYRYDPGNGPGCTIEKDGSLNASEPDKCYVDPNPLRIPGQDR